MELCEGCRQRLCVDCAVSNTISEKVFRLLAKMQHYNGIKWHDNGARVGRGRERQALFGDCLWWHGTGTGVLACDSVWWCGTGCKKGRGTTALPCHFNRVREYCVLQKTVFGLILQCTFPQYFRTPTTQNSGLDHMWQLALFQTRTLLLLLGCLNVLINFLDCFVMYNGTKDKQYLVFENKLLEEIKSRAASQVSH